MQLGFFDADNFLEFDIKENMGEITNGIVKGKVGFISFYKSVYLLNFKNFCANFITAFEKLEGQVELFDDVWDRFIMKMIFDRKGYIDIELSIADNNYKNRADLKFNIEQSYLNDFYREIKFCI